jgi:phage FluMu protein Com
MKDISERVSYLQGSSEGLNIKDGSPQGKVLSGMLSVMEDMADIIAVIQRELDEIKDYVDSIDQDLLDLEEDYRRDQGQMIEVKCPNCGEKLWMESDDENYDDAMEITCPKCNEVVFINEGSFDFEPAYIEDELDPNVNQETSPS